MLSRLAIALALAAVAAVAALPAAASSPTFFPRNCAHLAYKPATVGISCGDGSLYVTGVRYTSWTPSKASGSGSGHYNACMPTCAGGHFRVAPLTLKLSHPHYCAKLKKRAFTRLDYRFTVKPAAGYPQSGSASYSCKLFR